MNTLSLPMKRGVELPLVGVGDVGGDAGALPLGAGLAGVLPPGVGVLPEFPGFPVPPATPPAATSFHCWLAPPRSRFWTTSPPLALAAVLTPTAMPLKR